jgi:tRNA (mo5U34)-methyltransferase
MPGMSSPTAPPLLLPSRPDDPLLDGWYHTIDLGNGIVSKGHFDHRSVVDQYGIPESLAGKSVLDVGAGDGFFAFEMERRGAERVVAIDVDRVGDCDWVRRMRAKVPQWTMDATTWKTHFEMAHALLGSKVERITCSVYDLSPAVAGSFDLVFCADVLLHLQNPLGALENIRSVARDVAVIETVTEDLLQGAYPDHPYMRFGAAENEEEAGALNTFWRFNSRALQDMLLYAGFDHTEPVATFILPPTDQPAISVIAKV